MAEKAKQQAFIEIPLNRAPDMVPGPGDITNEGRIQPDGTIKPHPGVSYPPETTSEVTVVENVPVHKMVLVEQGKEFKELSWNEEQLLLLRATCAPNATDPEFKKLLYLSQVWQLDPMLREIWLVKFGQSPAQIYAGRDGFLKIAHRSGHFDGMKTVVNYDEETHPVSATCTVWRNDMTHPFESNVLFAEYSTGQNLWKTKPSVMIGKVAESVALRKAFSVAGLYSPDEMG